MHDSTNGGSINVDGLVKTYPDFTLGPLGLHVPPGTVVGLVGANGAGKTTFLKCLLGLTEPDQGTIAMLGMTTGPYGPTPSLKERLGVVLDTCAFTQESRIRDVAQLGQAAYRAWDQERFARLTQLYGLDTHKRVKELSRGMGMKLSLAFALSHDPDLLILDEATAGLDPLAREEVLEELRTFMADDAHSILMASHITTDLEKLADQIVCLDAGQVVFDLAKDTICDESGIAHCREADLELIASSPYVDAHGQGMRLLREAYSTTLLVPDRFSFARAFPHIPVDRTNLEGYLALMLKGDIL